MARARGVLFATARVAAAPAAAAWRRAAGYIARQRECRSQRRAPRVSDTEPCPYNLPMSYRWNPHPRWPAAQVEATAGAGGAAAAVLDAVALDRLRQLDPDNRTGLVKRVLQTYSQSLDRLLVQWQAARAAGDANALRALAHTLKSSSASVGALALSALCADVETRLRDGRRDGLEAQLDALADEAVRIRAALSPQWLSPSEFVR